MRILVLVSLRFEHMGRMVRRPTWCGSSILNSMMKATRQSKNEYIQMLLARGARPEAEVLYTNLSADAVQEVERRFIAEHKQFPWNCNTADGGEGILPGETYSVYGLKEPWADGRIFYIGIATDVRARLKQHIAEAKDSCLTLPKSPNFGLFLATFLNGCLGTTRVLEENSDHPTLSRFFYRTPEAYMAALGNYCDVNYDAVTLDCGWLVHKWLQKRNLLRIMATLQSVGGLFRRPSQETQKRSRI